MTFPEPFYQGCAFGMAFLLVLATFLWLVLKIVQTARDLWRPEKQGPCRGRDGGG